MANMDNQQNLDDFYAADPNMNFLDNMTFDDVMTETDTESVNPADLSFNTDFGNGFQAPQELVPAQPQVQQMPVQPAQQMLANQQTPAMHPGACYHPAVGWYFPTAEPAGIPPPPMFPMAAMTPASSVPTSGMSTPVPGPSNALSSNPVPQPARSQGKRKYGPGAYLDARAEGRNSIGNEEANYFASAASRRDGRGANTSASSFDSSFARRGTRPSIVQACICEDHKTERIKRPRNSFILFRSAKSEEIRRRLGTNQNQQVSKVASEEWRNAPPAVKMQYAKLAEEEKQRHALKHPDYKYKPGGITRSKFGTPSCICGAYKANMARVQEKKAGGRKLDTNSINLAAADDLDVDSDADSAYQPPRARHAPVAQMTTSAPPPDLDIASLGLPANQAAEASALLAGMKRKHNLTVSTSGLGNIAPEPPRKARRSSRTTAAVVNYAEPDEDADADFDDSLLDGADLFDFNAPCATPSTGKAERYRMTPSPKGRKASNASNGKKAGASQDSPLFVTPSPPARNTRSQARSEGSPSPLPPTPATAIKIEDSDDEDNIVVASPVKKKKKSSKTSTRSQTQRRRSLRSSER